MTSPASSLHPRLGQHATPVSILQIALDRGEVQLDLGLDVEQLHPVGDGVFSAKIDVPPGEWLVWANAGVAMWIGARVDALPLPVRRRSEGGNAHDVMEEVNALADVGVWLREAALLVDEDWTRSRRADSALVEVSARDVSALSGIFVDRRGRSARLELTRGGLYWTDRPPLAVEWLLTGAALSSPV